MIIILKKQAEEAKINALKKEMEEQGLGIHESEGVNTRILGLVGDTSVVDMRHIMANSIVENVQRIQEPYKKANRKFHPNDTVVDVNGVKIGGGNFQVIAHTLEQKHDGLILIGKCSQKGLKTLKRYEKNLISINRNSTTYEVDEVLCDGRKIALTAVNYLISCGHQKIGYVEDCHIGYQEALIHHGIAPDIDNVYDIMPNEKNGYHAMAYFSKLETPPTAFYCANDILAIGMLKYLAQSKKWYYHPSIISSDNIVESQYTTPMLTTVSLPKAEMAHLAIQILTDRMDGGHKAIVKTELQSTLIIRQSVRQYISTENKPEYYI